VEGLMPLQISVKKTSYKQAAVVKIPSYKLAAAAADKQNQNFKKKRPG
jgi:hypothetical protein